MQADAISGEVPTTIATCYTTAYSKQQLPASEGAAQLLMHGQFNRHALWYSTYLAHQ